MEESSWICKGAAFCAALLHVQHISASPTPEELVRSKIRFWPFVSTDFERRKSHLRSLGVHHRSCSGTRVQTPGAFTPRLTFNTTLPLARYFSSLRSLHYHPSSQRTKSTASPPASPPWRKGNERHHEQLALREGSRQIRLRQSRFARWR
jgi:hypothetical protein